MSIDALFANSVSCAKALRIPSQLSKSQARFAFCTKKGLVLDIQEDGGMVDGIGGTNWDGALVMSAAIEDWLLEMQNTYVKAPTLSSVASTSDGFPSVPAALKAVELGCGAGLVSILSRVLYDGTFAVMTDQETDLAVRNADSVVISESIHSFSQKYAIDDCGKKYSSAKEECRGDWESTLTALPLPWGSAGFTQCDSVLQSIQACGNVAFSRSGSSVCSSGDAPDLLFGAEIAVLYKQQPLLCETIDRLSGPQTLVLLSVDDVPKRPTITADLGSGSITHEIPKVASSTAQHKMPLTRPGAPPVGGYAAMLDRDMAERGFIKRVVSLQGVQWKKVRDLVTSDHGKSIVSDLYGSSEHDTTRDFGGLLTLGGSRSVEVALVHRASLPGADVAVALAGAAEGAALAPERMALIGLQPQEVHHICAYFRPPLLALMQEWAAQPGFPDALSHANATPPSPLLYSPSLVRCLLDSPAD
jgi:hypothetical protein